MDHKLADSRLEQRVDRALAGTAEFKAPEGLEARVLDAIAQRARVFWWRRRVPEWPLLAQMVFVLTGIATAAALLLVHPAAPAKLGTVIRQPAADLHATLTVLAVFHRLIDTMAGALPAGVWYVVVAMCAAGYVSLFLLAAFCYRLAQTPAPR
jgi:hypothetical protein